MGRRPRPFTSSFSPSGGENPGKPSARGQLLWGVADSSRGVMTPVPPLPPTNKSWTQPFLRPGPALGGPRLITRASPPGTARPAWPHLPGAARLILGALLLVRGQRGVVGPVGLAQRLLLLEDGRLVAVLVGDRGALQALRGRNGRDFQRLVNVADLRGPAQTQHDPVSGLPEHRHPGLSLGPSHPDLPRISDGSRLQPWGRGVRGARGARGQAPGCAPGALPPWSGWGRNTASPHPPAPSRQLFQPYLPWS